ncbi:carbohydrate ABC transporter permease [Naumannella cuiyingiana]|uniref:Raffinose/stachyose/melibiose transport system permease protein n=1 Tax=Naumannella cuiyingiana TaxID=1347891 RepID=A0A7Z0DC96_9ACTN|nr:carbohydrate ABC transporter permease [Naumannella cuiyingiana]NYI72691.1 raffinose/stachyose/melibiose transport system permease protein [Naumannella cuiyingiana]
MKERPAAVGITHALLILASIVALYPFFSILALAVSEPGRRPTGMSLPSSFTLDNFARAWTGGHFDQALVSSAIVSAVVVCGTVVLSALAAYPLAMMRVPFGRLIMGLLLLGLVMPVEAMIVPLYYQLRGLGLTNSYLALILPQLGLQLAFGTFWMRTAFADIPPSLSESAALDGASRLQGLRHVLLPVVSPAVGTLATLIFLFSWNEFLLALVMVPTNQAVQTAPLALSFFAGNIRTGDPGVTAAAAVLVALPVLVVYVFLQRRFISGMLSGAVKE